MEFSGVWTGYLRFTKHTKSSVQLCEVSRSIGKTSTLTLKVSNLLSLSPLSLSGYCWRPWTVPSACQASPVIPNESWAALNTLLLSSFRGDPGATRHRQTWAGWECWAGDFCRIYTYIRFQGLKLTSPSPRSAPRQKGLPVSARSSRCDTQRCSRGHTQHWMKAHEALTKWACRTWQSATTATVSWKGPNFKGGGGL